MSNCRVGFLQGKTNGSPFSCSCRSESAPLIGLLYSPYRLLCCCVPSYYTVPPGRIALSISRFRWLFFFPSLLRRCWKKRALIWWQLALTRTRLDGGPFIIKSPPTKRKKDVLLGIVKEEGLVEWYGCHEEQLPLANEESSSCSHHEML